MNSLPSKPLERDLLSRFRYSWFPLWTGSDRVVVVMYFGLHRWHPTNARLFFANLWSGYPWSFRVLALLRWMAFPLMWEAWEAKAFESRHHHRMNVRSRTIA